MYTYATEERHRQKLKENIDKALRYKAEHNVIVEDRIYPVLYGMNSRRQFIVWCPFCRKDHLHGENTKSGEHRVAHCANYSPFRDTGYIVAEDKVKYGQIKKEYPYFRYWNYYLYCDTKLQDQ